MVLEYFNRKPKAQTQPAANTLQSPVLTAEDERFFEKLAAEEAPALPTRPVVILDNAAASPSTSDNPPVVKDAQTALLDGANQIPLPTSPPVEDEQVHGKGKGKAMTGINKLNRRSWAFLSNVQAPRFDFLTNRNKTQAGTDLHDAAVTLKAPDNSAIPAAEKTAEEDELTSILDQLNLSAVNNRAFSFSEESQKLVNEFTQILKDIVNGVPTAYDDLEKLLTNSDQQLKKTYSTLPPFLQTLIKSLPAKLTAGLGPELLAASSEKPGADAKKFGLPLPASLKKPSIPTLKTLLGAQGAVATMLRSILQFLKFRFPAFVTGTNVLMSLAVFVLLFVFWYCHKRGREVRLEKEKLLTEGGVSAGQSDAEISDLEDSVFRDRPGDEEERAKIERILAQSDPAKVPLPQ